MFRYHMLTQTVLVYAMLISAAWVDQAVAQESRGARPAVGEVAVHRLKHADANSVAGALSELDLNMRIAAERSQGTVILRGDAEALEAAARVIDQLDRPAATEDSLETEYFTLEHRDAGRVQELAREVVSGFSFTRLTTDESTKLLIARGPSGFIDAIRQLVARVDRPGEARPAYTLRFYFIQGSIGGDSPTKSSLPSDLSVVADALGASGFGSLSLLAPVQTRAQEGESFESFGYVDRDDGGLEIKMEGRVEPGSVGDTVSLRVGAQLTHVFPEFSRTVFQVRTTLETRIGDYVVLAAAPGGPSQQALALVVRAEQ